MKAPNRITLGTGAAALLAFLVSAVVFGFELSQRPGDDSEVGLATPTIADPAAAGSDRGKATNSTDPGGDPGSQGPGQGLEPGSVRGDEATTSDATGIGIDPPTSDSAPSQSSTPSPAQPADGASTTSTNTRTSEGSSSPTAASSPETISGRACPCTITGEATLQGSIELEGDISVVGGVLTARPGVDLEGNGHQIVFTNGGRADFRGTEVFTWSENGSRMNLERDINFRNLRRIMFHKGAGPSTLEYFTISDSGGPSAGEYPIHFHLNGDSTRGTIVEGVVVLNGRHHAFVPHGSHGITFRDTIAKNTNDVPYWWDPPGSNNCAKKARYCTTDNSNDIVYDHVLADGVSPPISGSNYRLSAFLLGAGSGNVIRNSVARSVEKSVQCSGFHWPEGSNNNVGGNVWTFRDNTAITGPDCHGIFVWQNDHNNGPHIVDGFTGTGVDHGAYVNDYVYRDIDVPYFDFHALGWGGVSGGRIGSVTIRKHRVSSNEPIVFEDVAIEGPVIVDNVGGENNNPSITHFNGTGLSCSDVEFRDVVPGTKIVVDGVTC